MDKKANRITKNYVKTNNLEYILTSHKIGLKKIIENQGEDYLIPQIAIGLLKKGEKIASHKHQSMIEYYYIIKGKGEFIIESETIYCETGDFIKVKNNLNHSIFANKDLEFFYFGINIEKNGEIF